MYIQFMFHVFISFYIPLTSGWDEGCLTMCLGEKARLYIAGYKGYGEKGFSAWGVSLT